MAGKLITLPVRVSLRSAQLLRGAAGCALSIPGHAIQVVTPGRSRRAARESAPAPAPAPEPRKWRRQPSEGAIRAAEVEPPPPPAHAPAPARVRNEPAAEVSGLPFEAPVHVSREAELVRESAEPGAEDGAGANVTVKEPWAGYRLLSARDVIDHTRTANVAELAAVQLYESGHRSRRTVLAAVDRQLKLATGGVPA